MNCHLTCEASISNYAHMWDISVVPRSVQLSAPPLWASTFPPLVCRCLVQGPAHAQRMIAAQWETEVGKRAKHLSPLLCIQIYVSRFRCGKVCVCLLLFAAIISHFQINMLKWKQSSAPRKKKRNFRICTTIVYQNGLCVCVWVFLELFMC